MKQKLLLEEQGSVPAAQQIDITELLPSQLPSGKKILWRDIGEGKIEVYCDKYGVRGGTAKPIVVNRNIPICELLFEGFGLWAGMEKNEDI